MNPLAIKRRRDFITYFYDLLPEDRKQYYLGMIDALTWVIGDDDE